MMEPIILTPVLTIAVEKLINAIGDQLRLILSEIPASVNINLVTHPNGEKEDYLRIVNLSPVAVRIKTIRIFGEGLGHKSRHDLPSIRHISRGKDPYGEKVHYRIAMAAEEAVFLYPGGFYYLPWSELPNNSKLDRNSLRVWFRYWQSQPDPGRCCNWEKAVPVVQVIEPPTVRP